jgi:D-arabinose 1-dehydrogenase-like Zn-dependent alcohol dehydrogenase
VRAGRIHRWGGELRVEEVPDPRPAEDEVLVRVEACGVGLTVLNCIRGDLGDDPDDLPRVPGHELVGTIVETGAGVDPGRQGERVTAHFYLFCGRCPRCLAAQEPICDNLAGWVGVDRDGGYAELVALPGRNAVALPAGLDPVLATTIPDAIATPVHVCRRALVRPGERVAVVAAGGGVGMHMVQVARVYGAEVAGLDVGAEKLEFLERELEVRAVPSHDFGAVQLPLAWGGRSDVVVDLLGTAESLRWGVDHLASGGRLVTLTSFRGVNFPISSRELVFREAAILGSRYASRHELALAARLLAEGRVRPVIGRREPVDRVAGIHEDIAAGRLLGRGALVW